MRPATVERLPESPALEPDFQGVKIALAPRESPAQPVILHGTFRIAWEHAGHIQPPRQRALVLVVTSKGGQTVRSPFEGQVLFPDDEVATHGGAFGHFNLDVGALLGRAPTSEVFALVSIGPFTSNVVRVAPV